MLLKITIAVKSLYLLQK